MEEVTFNVGWFQPVKHLCSFSVDVMFLVRLNVSRQLRFKQEIAILDEIIPAWRKNIPQIV